MTAGMTVLGVWIAAFLTLAVLSFLFKDNPLYKFAEHLVVGLSAGYWFIVLYNTTFRDLISDPLKADFSSFRLLPRAAGSNIVGNGLLLDGIPIVLGLMIWTRFWPKAAWTARIPIAYVLGAGAGLAIPTALDNFVVTPLKATLALPIVPGFWQTWTAQILGATAPAPQLGIGEALSNLLIVVGVFCGIVYFFFSKEHKGVTGATANVGIWILMIGFGSTFGFTVMSRVSLLVGRFEFLLNRWILDSFWRLIFPGH
jgi:hypothetical protein